MVAKGENEFALKNQQQKKKRERARSLKLVLYTFATKGINE